MTKQKENFIKSSLTLTPEEKAKEKKPKVSKQMSDIIDEVANDNIEQEKHAGGRPPKYKTPNELEEAIEIYINPETCPDTIKHIVGESIIDLPCQTVSGLAYYLGFCDRQSLYDYSNKNDEFSCIVKKARLAIERRYEQNLSKNSPAGSIFALKNMGWRDKTEVDNTIKVEDNTIKVTIE